MENVIYYLVAIFFTPIALMSGVAFMEMVFKFVRDIKESAKFGWPEYRIVRKN
ncbi:MAG: hypothetical protein H6937_02340 [Burkholderiales bacterium]|nr:hypothetical protein [Burkholderiales bacterium]